MNHKIELSKAWADMLNCVALQFTRGELVKDVLTQRHAEILPFLVSYCRERIGPSVIEDSITVTKCKMSSEDDKTHGTLQIAATESTSGTDCLTAAYFTLDFSSRRLIVHGDALHSNDRSV